MSSADPIPELPQDRPARGVETRSFATWRVILALILREMTTRYSRTPGGYVWALLQPLGTILILGMAFSLVMRMPSLGSSFILFYATAYLPFDVYRSVANAVSKALKFSKPLLAYPSVTWLDAVLARLILNILTSVMVTYVLTFAILMVVDTQVVLEFAPMVMAMGLAALMGLGVGVMNCLLMGLFPTWEMLWSIVTAPLFLASGVLYIYEDLPSAAQNLLWYNPLIHVTGMMRSGFFPMYTPSYVSPMYVLVVSLILIALGLLLLRRYHKAILNF